MKRQIKGITAGVLIIATLFLATPISDISTSPLALRSNFTVSAETYIFGDLAYEIHDDEIEIVEYLGTSETVVVPSEIDGVKVTVIGNKAQLPNYEIHGKLPELFIEGAFEGKDIKFVTLPTNLTEIRENAFKNCISLKTIDIPDSVSYIGESAFRNCSSLKDIHFAEGLTEIKSQAFEGCSKLTSVNIPKSVISIGDSVFRDCSSLDTVSIPDGIVTIESRLFYGCSKLSEVFLPQSVLYIMSEAFFDCVNLSTIDLHESVEEIGISAFENCSSLATPINIPSNITKIESRVFMGCSSLTEIVISDSVTEIGFAAFANCRSLKSVKLPQSIKKIGHSVFSGCYSLMNVNIPEKLIEIDMSTFSNCCSLESIAIPKNIVTIKQYAFLMNNSQIGTAVGKKFLGYFTDPEFKNEIIAEEIFGGMTVYFKWEVVVETLKGDVNLDGKVDAEDIIFLKQAIYGRQPLSPNQAESADMDSNSKLDVFDLALLKRNILN